MVNIARGVINNFRGSYPFLEIDGIKLGVRIVEGKLIIETVNNNNSIGALKLESCLAKLRGYYSNTERFEELKHFFDRNTRNLTTLNNVCYDDGERDSEEPRVQPEPISDVNDMQRAMREEARNQVERERPEEPRRNIRDEFVVSTPTSTPSRFNSNN